MNHEKREFAGGAQACPNPHCQQQMKGMVVENGREIPVGETTPSLCGNCGELVLLVQQKNGTAEIKRATTVDFDQVDKDDQMAISSMQLHFLTTRWAHRCDHEH